jgi:serine/threonine protein phosphatase 1
MSADAVSPLTFAVGDIHGCLDKLDRLIAACEARAGGRPARYVFVGESIAGRRAAT